MPIDDADRKRIVQAIRSHIARERISREELPAAPSSASRQSTS